MVRRSARVAAMAPYTPDLPPEMLVAIAEQLQSAIDLCRMHSVCTVWNAGLGAAENCRGLWERRALMDFPRLAGIIDAELGTDPRPSWRELYRAQFLARNVPPSITEVMPSTILSDYTFTVELSAKGEAEEARWTGKVADDHAGLEFVFPSPPEWLATKLRLEREFMQGGEQSVKPDWLGVELSLFVSHKFRTVRLFEEVGLSEDDAYDEDCVHFGDCGTPLPMAHEGTFLFIRNWNQWLWSERVDHGEPTLGCASLHVESAVFSISLGVSTPYDFHTMVDMELLLYLEKAVPWNWPRSCRDWSARDADGSR